MNPPIYLVNYRFGRLVVLSPAPKQKRQAMWNCVCDCGNVSTVQGGHLKSGRTKSCGCLRKAPRGARPDTTARNVASKTHGDAGRGKVTPEYRCWVQMRNRCSNSNSPLFKYYGARGIRVCQRWLKSYANFLADMGRRPSNAHSIDRKDNNGNYEPSNCRWATKAQQSSNKRFPPRGPDKNPKQAAVKWAKSMLAAANKPGVDPKWSRGIKRAVRKKLESLKSL